MSPLAGVNPTFATDAVDVVAVPVPAAAPAADAAASADAATAPTASAVAAASVSSNKKSMCKACSFSCDIKPTDKDGNAAEVAKKNPVLR